MKNITISIFQFIILSAIIFNIGCKKDETPCPGITCKNEGTIIKDCKCECPEGITGESCEFIIPTDGLVTWYPFNNGNAIDLSNMKNNGIINGALPTEDRKGNQNAAFYFDGNASIISQNTDLTITNEATFSAWIKTSYPDLQLIATKYGSMESGVEISTGEYQGDHTGEALCGGRDQNNEFKLSGYSGTGLHDNTWHMVTDVVEGQVWKIYVDGKLKSQHPYNDGQTTLTNDQPIRIGGMMGWPSPWFFTGSIDDVRIYNRALSGEEIEALFAE